LYCYVNKSQNYSAPHGGPFSLASLHWSPLVVVFQVSPAKEDHHRTTCRAGSCNLPAGFSQSPRPRSAEDPTGVLRENFFRLRPSPQPSCQKNNENSKGEAKIRRIQKVVRPDNDSIPDEVTLSPRRTTHDQKKRKSKRKFQEIYQVPPYLTGKPETKILSSVRGCGGASSVSGDGVTKNFSWQFVKISIIRCQS
jgi:hypothetical protein